jgi:hypothetical protein
MNTNDPKSSQDPNELSKKSPDKSSEGPSLPITPPLASPNEPKRTYPNGSSPSEPSKVYTTEPLDTARIPGDEMKTSGSYSQKNREGQKTRQETFEDRTRDSFRNFRDSKKIEELYDYAQTNKEQTIAYILLALGLLFLLFFNNMLGGLLIGMVAGYYFSSEIFYYIRNIGQIIGGQDQLRYVVLTALLLGLFIAAPGIFIGAAIVATFKQVMFGSKDHSNHN